MVWIVNYWKYALVFLSLSVLSTSLMWMTISNTKLESKVALQAKDLEHIAKEREQDAKEYETAINEYATNIQKVEVVYQDRIKTIYNIQGDNNANDCNDTAFVLNSIEY
jgi:hypothetical protein